MAFGRPARIPRPHWEVIAIVIGYSLLFDAVIGPYIGSMTAFDTPAIVIPEVGRGSIIQSFTTVRGWILFVTLGVLVILYVHLRPRLSDEDPTEFWKVTEE